MTPIFVAPPLTYREAHFMETMLQEYIRLNTHWVEDEAVSCADCSCSIIDGEPHHPDCDVQIAYDLLNRLDGYPLPHEM